MNINKSNLVIIFVIMAILAFARGQTSIEQTLLSLPGLLIALSLHEFAHAYTAYKLGDPTPEMQGRVTISPLAHLDPVGTICLLFAGFGWGKPVQINPMNFKNPEKDSAKVAAAGPIMNLLLSVIFAIVYGIVIVIGIKTDNYNTANASLAYIVISNIVIYAMLLNIGLALFNLLPFPPLDGSKIYRAFLKGKAKQFLYFLERYSWLFIMILFMTHLASYIIIPIENWIVNNILLPIINAVIQLGV